MKLATKIGILVALILAVSLLIQVFFVLPQIREREFNLQKALYQAKAVSLVSEVKNFQDDIHYKVELLTRMPEIKSMNVNQQELILSISLRSSWRFETAAIGIADMNGMITCFESHDLAMPALSGKAVGEDISGLDFFRYCISTGKTCFSDPFVAADGLRAVTFAAPIRKADGNVAGVVFTDVSLENMISAVDNLQLEENESVYIIDKNGLVIAHSAEKLGALPGGCLSLDYSKYAIVQELIKGNSGAAEYDLDGVQYLASYMTVGASGWGVVFQEPLSIVTAKGNVLPNFLLGANAAVFVLAVLVTLLLVHRITRPLGKLARYAKRVEEGDYTAGLAVRGKDEIAEVTSAITTMVKQMVVSREEEVATLIGSMKDGIMVLDRQQRLTRLNPAMEQMLDINADDVLGKNVSQLQAELRFAPLARLSKVQSLGEEVVFAYPTHRVLRVHSSKLNGKGDKDEGEVRVVIDVTQEKELDQMKSDFIANTTHELRTPLHSIRGFIKLMLDGKVSDPETQREFLSIIDTESQHLNNLVDNILDIAAIESGRMVIERKPVSMREVIDGVVNKLQQLAENKEINIKVSLSHSLPVIEGDFRKLEQVVRNLVSNAIKFSPTGSQIFIDVRKDGAGVLVKVIDQGIGIPADAIPELFQKFSQVDSSMTRAQKGTGLGLYISKQIVEGHGGRIWVESVHGEGATFFFFIPSVQEERKRRKKIGEMLIENGLITKEELRDILRMQEDQ